MVDMQGVSPKTLELLQKRSKQVGISVDELLQRLLAADALPKQVEETAQRSQQILQQIFDNAHFLLAYLDKDFNFIQVNEQYAQADDKIPKYFVGNNHFNLYPNAENEAIFRQVVETGKPVIIQAKPFVYPLNPERGTTYWDWSLVPVFDTNQQVEGLILTLFDVTAHIQTEQQLGIKESAIESAITAIALADLAGQLFYVNPAFLKLWKHRDAHEVLGRSVLEFWESPAAAQAVVQAISDHENYLGELQATLADGTIADVELSATMVKDASGNPICMMASFKDITKEKQAEAYALANERLKARFQKEQERNVLVQRIISTLSHDLKTSLTVISMAGDMLGKYHDRLTPEQRYNKLESIGRQVGFAIDLLEETVDIARGNLSETAFQPTEMDIAALCQVSVNELQLKTTTHQLTFSNPKQLETVYADEVLISRILLNLLSNAIKYSPNGGEIHIEIDQPDTWLVLRVSDTGMGISETDLHRVFEPLYRADEAENIPGSGLGLSIVKECVERHHGTIRVESKLHQGTTFTIELPLKPTSV